MASPILLILYGLGATSAVKGAFLIQLQGPFAVFLSVLFLRERLVFGQVVGVILLITGNFLVVMKYPYVRLWEAYNYGDALVLAGAIGLGFSFIFIKRLSTCLSALQLSTLRLLLGAGLIVPAVFFARKLL